MLRNMFMKLYRMQLKRKYNEIKSKVPIQLKQSRKQREREIFFTIRIKTQLLLNTLIGVLGFA